MDVINGPLVDRVRRDGQHVAIIARSCRLSVFVFDSSNWADVNLSPAVQCNAMSFLLKFQLERCGVIRVCFPFIFLVALVTYIACLIITL